MESAEARTVPERLRAALAGKTGIRLAYVFGSAARGELRPGSDVDVGLRFASRPSLGEMCELAAELEHALSRRVDLVDLDAAPPLLLREIVKEGRLVWASDDDERVDFEVRALARYADTAHLRRVQHKHLHEWAEAYRAGEG